MDAVAQAPEQLGERGALGGAVEAVEQSIDVVAMTRQGLVHALRAELGEAGIRAPAVARTGLPDDEVRLDEAVDGAREPARGEPGLGGEIAHSQPVPRRARQANEQLEGLAPDAELILEARAECPAQPGSALEHEADEGNPILPRSLVARRHVPVLELPLGIHQL